MSMPEHKQVFVKVNAEVDAGISSVVSALSELEGLQTLESCEGEPGRKSAYVYFRYGNWDNVSRFTFRELAPKLARAASKCRVGLEVFGGSHPTAKIEFSAEATDSIASALMKIVKSDRSSACYGGKSGTTPRS
jgi:hypothetical protein